MAAWVFFDSFKTNTINGTNIIDFDTDLIKIALITVGNVPDINVDDFWDDLVATEVTGTNYTARGEALTTPVVSEAAGTVTFNADDVTWNSNAGGFANARHAILYFDSTVNTTSPLIATLDFAVDKGNTTGDLTIQMDVLGLITLT